MPKTAPPIPSLLAFHVGLFFLESYLRSSFFFFFLSLLCEFLSIFEIRFIKNMGKYFDLMIEKFEFIHTLSFFQSNFFFLC